MASTQTNIALTGSAWESSIFYWKFCWFKLISNQDVDVETQAQGSDGEDSDAAADGDGELERAVNFSL